MVLGARCFVFERANDDFVLLRKAYEDRGATREGALVEHPGYYDSFIKPLTFPFGDFGLGV